MGLSDERLLQLAGLSAGLHNAWLLADPKSFHDFHLTQDQAYSPTSLRFAGLAGTTATAQMVAVGASKPNKETVRNALAAAGACFLAVGAYHAYNGQVGVEKKPVALTAAVTEAALGALCLWHGTRRD